MSKQNLRNRLFGLFIIIGAIPLLIVLVINGILRVSQLEEDVKSDMWLKTSSIEEYMTQRLERNFHVLHIAATNPILQRYVETDEYSLKPTVTQILNEVNWGFKDSSTVALTDSNGGQLFRTDNRPLVNISKREHFKRAMLGKDYVSNVLNSMSTGNNVIVLETPIKNSENKVIGLLQRNFETSAYQNFIDSLTDDTISIIILDREGKLLAYTNRELFGNSADESVPIPYGIISQTMAGVFGVTRGEINGIDSLIGYKRNSLTDWPIVIIYPYSQIYQTVNKEISRLALLGLLCLFVVSILSYRFSSETIKPIRRILHNARSVETENVQVDSNDEVEEISHVLNEIRFERDTYRQEIERDTLTGLYTKTAVETIFRKKHQNYDYINQNFDFTALYLINLDYFKNLNKKFGHIYGDRVLLEFSQRLKKFFRPLDCVGRLEANEFVVIADQFSDTAEVYRKAEQIVKIARSLVLDNQPVELTASVGISLFPKDGNSYETLITAASDALSKAKSEGRNRFYANV